MIKNSQSDLEELVISTLAMPDGSAKLLIAEHGISDEEFKTQLSAELADAWINSFSRAYCPLSGHSGSTATD